MGGLLTLGSFLRYFPQIDTANPPDGDKGKASNIQGITVGGYTLGCFFGAVATIWLGNLLGRKRTILVGSTIMVIGAAIQCSSFSLGQLIASRLITGFGNGMPCLCLQIGTDTDRHRHEYVDSPDLAIRNIKIPPSRPNGHDRRLAYRLRRHAFVLD